MSYAAFKVVHPPTGVENCVSAYLTHCAGRLETDQDVDVDVRPASSGSGGVSSPASSYWGLSPRLKDAAHVGGSALPNLVLSKANVLEIYHIRVQEGFINQNQNGLPPVLATNGSWASKAAGGRRGGFMAGVLAVWLELVCAYRLHGNVENMAVLSLARHDGRRLRDAIILTFQDAKISVLAFDDSTHNLRICSLHSFEGPEWLHLKRGREKFPRGPFVRADPLGRCAGVLLYDSQLVLMKAAQVGDGLVEEDEGPGPGSTVSARIESSYVVSLRDMDMKHIKDFVFLNGFIEPVVLFLHEKEPTWTGRVGWKRHTNAITALSINTSLKQHPVIWAATDLPYDSYKLLAVPSPIGGVVVVCANSLHYCSQSTLCSLGLNEFAVTPDGSIEMPKSKISVELDGAHAAWISHDVALFSTKAGNLLLLSLVFDGRVVQKLELSKSRASVLASCLCVVRDSFFFLGSRLGDSLLVQYTSGTISAGSPTGTLKDSNEEHDEMDGDSMQHPPKRICGDSSDLSQEGISAEELSLYYSSPSACDSPKRKTFSFAVRDSLVNIGPLRDIAYGPRMHADGPASSVNKQSNYELVACSGHGKNGSLSILHQSIRPDLITEVDLPGCNGVWTVYHQTADSATSEAHENPNADHFHAYLIISLETRTMVLETGDMLGEVTESVEYFTEGPTISAGNLFGRQRVAQVYSEGVRLLDGVLSTGELLIQESTADTEPGNRSQILIEMADVADPYIMLRMNDGSVRLVTGDPESLTLAWCKLPLSDGPSDVVTACSLYVDRGPHPWLRGTVTNAHLPENNSSSGSHSFCIVARKSGKLEFYELPSLSCVFSMRSFTQGSAILVDEKVHHEYTVNGLEIIPESEEQDNDALESDMGLQIVVTEIRMVKWGNKFGRPFLFAILSDDSILSYHAFMFEREINDSSYAPLPSAITADDSDTVLPDEKSRLSSLRFARVPLEWVSGAEEGWEPTSSGQRIFSFENIGNIEGVFLTGPRPHWLMVFRERIRVHPQLCDGGIVAITPLHNVNCNHGFIYITSKGLLKICQLPSLLIYDSDWPLQKIPLRGTAYQITYYAEVNLYALIVSAPGSCLGSELHSESDNTLEDAQKLVTSEEFEVRILEPAKLGCAWETRQTIKMHTTEIALTVRIVSVKNIVTAQTQTFLAIGTAFVQGEDVGAKGRIVLVSVGQDPSDPTIWVREVYSKELKGAISAVASLQGRLLVAIGPKIILHNWNGVELNGAAFFDAPLYVVSLNVVKNFVLFGDIQKSIYFLCWKEEGAQLVLLAKDFGELDCYATEFLIDGGTLSLLVSDSRKNIQIFSYAPKSVESWKGQKLLPRAEFHVGSHAQKFLRLQMLPVSSGARSNRFALFFGTLDGGIGYVAPLDELTFRRLQSLQRKLLYSVSHFGGLNPRSFRQFRSEGQTHRPGPEHIVDCELLCHYETLPLDEQVEVARQIGTTRAQILSNFRDLAISTSLM